MFLQFLHVPPFFEIKPTSPGLAGASALRSCQGEASKNEDKSHAGRGVERDGSDVA